MSLEMIAQEVQEMEKSVHMNLRKSIDFEITGKTLKAGATEKKKEEESKRVRYVKEIKEIGGEVRKDPDDYGIEPYGSHEQATERQIRELNWNIQSCDRRIKTCERIIEHCKDSKTYKLNEYEMEDYGL